MSFMAIRPTGRQLASSAVLEPFLLLVGYNKSFDEMVEAGNYDEKDPRIVAWRFPMCGTGVVAYWAKIFHFGYDLPMQDAVAMIKADTSGPWELDKIECLLAFGEKYPEEQRNYPIIMPEAKTALGAETYMPYLHGTFRERCLDLCWPGICGPGAHFLGVHRAESPV